MTRRPKKTRALEAPAHLPIARWIFHRTAALSGLLMENSRKSHFQNISRIARVSASILPSTAPDCGTSRRMESMISPTVDWPSILAITDNCSPVSLVRQLWRTISSPFNCTSIPKGRNVGKRVTRNEVDPVAAWRSLRPASHKEMAGVSEIDPFHDRPLLFCGEASDRGEEGASRRRGRVIWRLEEQILEHEVSRRDKFAAVLNREAPFAFVKKRVDQPCIKFEVGRQRQIAPDRMILRQFPQGLLDHGDGGVALDRGPSHGTPPEASRHRRGRTSRRA